MEGRPDTNQNAHIHVFLYTCTLMYTYVWYTCTVCTLYIVHIHKSSQASGYSKVETTTKLSCLMGKEHPLKEDTLQPIENVINGFVLYISLLLVGPGKRSQSPFYYIIDFY